ncbi:MAG: hypothetical protein WEG56_14070 [Chloroflexota bacterium]
MRPLKHGVLLAIVLVASMTWLGTPTARAAPDVVVKVTLDRIRLTGGDDGCGDPDWYAKVFINGIERSNLDTPEQDAQEGNADISPPGGWEFSSSVDAAALADPGRIPLSIEIWEEDGGLCFGDDLFDASQSAGSAISGTALIAPCGASLDGRAITCGASSVFAGTSSDRVEVTLRVEVTPPPSAPGLRIRCMHTPAWPQAGQPVTITATPLDGALAPLIADDLEIWVQTDASSVATRAKVVDLAGVPSATYTFTPAAGVEQFAYGCRLTRGGTEIFSSWHRATAGDPGTVDIPILYTGPRSSRIDIVFIADRDTYPSAEDPNFLADVAQVINISYYGFDPFLTGQDKFNFWIDLNQGRADDANDGDCDHDLPARWDEDLAYADAGAILHRKSQRDCALRGDRIFSGTLNTGYRSDAFQVVTHETGHQPFGLADEYCCDGGYFQQDDAPNVYSEPDDCQDDAPALGRTSAACREWEEVVENWFDPDWSSSEPNGGDLMNDNSFAQAADIRRFNMIFSGCEAAGC